MRDHLLILSTSIADPDRSNPTRSRWERPLDTIRAFEEAIDGKYSRTSARNGENSHKKSELLCRIVALIFYSGTDSADTASQFNRRSSYYAGRHISLYFPLFGFCGGKAQLESFTMGNLGRALLVLQVQSSSSVASASASSWRSPHPRNNSRPVRTGCGRRIGLYIMLLLCHGANWFCRLSSRSRGSVQISTKRLSWRGRTFPILQDG